MAIWQESLLILMPKLKLFGGGSVKMSPPLLSHQPRMTSISKKLKMSKFLAAGISQNKTSILETADRPDLSSLEQPTCFWATTTPRCTFQQSKHQKWKKVREWIPQSITQVSDRLCPVMLAFLATASSSVFVGKPKTGNLTSKFRLLKSCPTPKNVGQQGTLDTCYLWKLGQASVHSWKLYVQ